MLFSIMVFNLFIILFSLLLITIVKLLFFHYCNNIIIIFVIFLSLSMFYFIFLVSILVPVLFLCYFLAQNFFPLVFTKVNPSITQFHLCIVFFSSHFAFSTCSPFFIYPDTHLYPLYFHSVNKTKEREQYTINININNWLVIIVIYQNLLDCQSPSLVGFYVLFY